MTAIDRALLNHGFPGSTWGNLGLWTETQNYPAACEALAIRLAEAAQLRPGCSVLDVGFGYGDQLLVWKNRFGVGRITGIETDEKGIAEARRKLAAYPDVCLHLSNGKPKPSAERYDRVLALDCAYHFAPRSAFFTHAFQTLRPGGVIALTDIAIANSARSGVYIRLAKWCGVPPENLLTQQDYRQALLDAGFCNVKVDLLDGAVLSGFARFAWSLFRRRRLAAFGSGGRKVIATAVFAAWLQRHRHVHYIVVSADTSPGSI